MAKKVYNRWTFLGEVSEWSKVPPWKGGVRASVPGVRIPPSPPLKKYFFFNKVK